MTAHERENKLMKNKICSTNLKRQSKIMGVIVEIVTN